MKTADDEKLLQDWQIFTDCALQVLEKLKADDSYNPRSKAQIVYAVGLAMGLVSRMGITVRSIKE